jgi:acetyl-CoA C-acetyltransferase/acetyl-CoA acyltransferase 2
MANTAENLAEQYGITREEVDAYALRSQQATKAAQERCDFSAEIVPVTVKTKKGTVTVDRDEHPRPATTAEDLAKLPPVFRQNGVVTAGNASGIVDGAAAVVLATDEGLNGKKPIGRIVSWGIVGVEPRIMGIGPAEAIPVALQQAGLSLDDIDLFEINEAFASVAINSMRMLGIDDSKVNVNGGAIALGHPIGASGARILGSLVHELRRRGGGLGVAAICSGGGQGDALIIEVNGN